MSAIPCSCKNSDEILEEVPHEKAQIYIIAFGEVIEIDDGLCPYYFYYFGFLKLIPIPIFHPPGKDIKTKEEH